MTPGHQGLSWVAEAVPREAGSAGNSATQDGRSAPRAVCFDSPASPSLSDPDLKQVTAVGRRSRLQALCADGALGVSPRRRHPLATAVKHSHLTLRPVAPRAVRCVCIGHCPQERARNSWCKTKAVQVLAVLLLSLLGRDWQYQVCQPWLALGC
jgi:hypothetical protein